VRNCEVQVGDKETRESGKKRDGDKETRESSYLEAQMVKVQIVMTQQP
jgi:hypothetical protein